MMGIPDLDGVRVVSGLEITAGLWVTALILGRIDGSEGKNSIIVLV
jgi:hypothetical protein